MIIGLFSFSRSLFSPEKMPGVHRALDTYFKGAPWWRMLSPLPSLVKLQQLSQQNFRHHEYPSLVQIIRCFDLDNLNKDSEDWRLFCDVVEAFPLQQYLSPIEMLALLRALSVYEIADNGKLQECIHAYFRRKLPRPLSPQQLIKLHQMTEGKMSVIQLLTVITYCDVAKLMSLIRSYANTKHYDLDVFITMTRASNSNFADGSFDRSDSLCELFALFPERLSMDQLASLFRIGHNGRLELVTMVEFLLKQEHLDNDLVKKQLLNIIGFDDQLECFIAIINCLLKNGAGVDDATFKAITNYRDLQYLRNAVVLFETNEPLLFPAYIHTVVQHAYAFAMAEAITELRYNGYLFPRNIEILKSQINPRKAANLMLSFHKYKLSDDVVDEVFGHDADSNLAAALLILIQGGLWPGDKTKQKQLLDFLKNHDSQQPAAIASIMVYNRAKKQGYLKAKHVLTLLHNIGLLVDWDAVKSIYDFCQFPLSPIITPEVVEMIIDNKDLLCLPHEMVLYALSLVNCLCPSLESETIIDPSIAFPQATQVLKRVAESCYHTFKAVGKAAAHLAAEIYVLAPDEVKKDCWPGQWNKDCDRPLTQFFAAPSVDECSEVAVADKVYAQAATKRAAH